MGESVRPLRAGVIGLGMGKQHIRAYREDPNCQVVAVCDMNESLLNRIADEFNVEHRFTDAGKMFESGLVDVVSVATPNAYHAPLSIAALDAGLHVLCEKPMAMSAPEAKRMLDAADRNNRKLAIHFNHRMNPSVHTLRRYVQSGDLGEVYYARTIWHRRRGIPARPSFLSMQHAGGGAMIDLGVHMLDQTLFIMGYPRIRSVSAETYTMFAQLDVPDIAMDVDDFAVALLRFENDATLSMEISWASHHDHPEQTLVQVYGSKGGVLRRTEDYKEIECSVHHREHGALVSSRLVRAIGKVHSVQTDLLEAIRQDRQPLCSGRHGYEVMRVLDAIYDSSRAGREIVLAEQPVEA